MATGSKLKIRGDRLQGLQMTRLPKTQAHWSLVASALKGTLCGLITATVFNFVNTFYGDISGENAAVHVFTQTTLLVAVGAILFTLISAIHNWLNSAP